MDLKRHILEPRDLGTRGNCQAISASPRTNRPASRGRVRLRIEAGSLKASMDRSTSLAGICEMRYINDHCRAQRDVGTGDLDAQYGARDAIRQQSHRSCTTQRTTLSRCREQPLRTPSEINLRVNPCISLKISTSILRIPDLNLINRIRKGMQVNFDPCESKRKGISFCSDSPWILHRAASSAFRANRRRFLLAAAVKVRMVWRTARAARSGQWRPAARHGPFAPSASSNSQGRCFASLLRRASSESAKWQVCPLRSPHLESSSGRSLLGAACPNKMLLRPM